MFRILPPHPSLAHLVRSYCALDDVHTPLTEEHRLYPECTTLLAFLHGESYLGIGSDMKRLPGVYVQGFRDFPVRLRSCGPTRLVGVEFYPWGAIRLLGPAGPTHGVPCSIPEHVSPLLAARIDRLLAARQQDEALSVVEEWLLGRAAQVDLQATPAITVANRLVQTRGQGTVAQLAEGVGLSVRQLERQFQTQVGMSPKLLARVSRFEAAQRLIFEGEAQSFTRLAHDLGYADQAHFTREFRAFAELSPSGFVTELQDFLHRQGHVAFVQAERAVGL